MDQEETLLRIKEAWSHFPHLRFGQFLSNVITLELPGFNVYAPPQYPGGGNKPELVGVDTFYIENRDLVEACEDYAHFHKG